MEVKPSECLVLEDSVNGVTAAKRRDEVYRLLKLKPGNQDLSKADKIVTTLERLEYKDLFNNPGKK